jgi:hypothetical protein
MPETDLLNDESLDFVGGPWGRTIKTILVLVMKITKILGNIIILLSDNKHFKIIKNVKCILIRKLPYNTQRFAKIFENWKLFMVFCYEERVGAKMLENPVTYYKNVPLLKNG